MNREIKFRVWDKENKQMIRHISGIMFEGVEPSVTLTGRDWQHNSQDWEMLYPKQYELMQFTGLKDKNGNEIYEGDLVKTQNGDIGEIRYCPPYFGIDYHEDLVTGVSNYTVEFLMASEVCGNIFDDTELLKINRGA